MGASGLTGAASDLNRYKVEYIIIIDTPILTSH